jgi:hypothetical protein
MLVVIGFIILELPLKITPGPKEGLIEALAPYGPHQSLNESVGTGRTGNRFNLANFKHAKIRQPAMKAKQRIMIRGEVARRCLLWDYRFRLDHGDRIQNRREKSV